MLIMRVTFFIEKNKKMRVLLGVPTTAHENAQQEQKKPNWVNALILKYEWIQ
ncbi:MAG: hypothetical protein HAW62_04325 [Endozoicomonadaceae bacterium]|nr:hypothetical protein [Endozoicomonadaceae bacterium]